MNEIQYVIFTLNEESFGLSINYVKEISPYKKSNMLPHTPDFVDGIINYRGQVTPIINLRKKFQMPEQDPTELTRIILTILDEKQVGLLVDEASQVITLSEDVIDSAPKIMNDNQKEYIQGIAKLEDKMITLLDIEMLLNNDN